MEYKEWWPTSLTHAQIGSMQNPGIMLAPASNTMATECFHSFDPSPESSQVQSAGFVATLFFTMHSSLQVTIIAILLCSWYCLYLSLEPYGYIAVVCIFPLCIQFFLLP